ncbi:type I methionyl aminopeptidase [Sutterella faecalis]|uniref:Methionine aminopeptidase n=2 Tax=Sutterella TaxID=40544 RepID=A0AAI9SD37_9BURK|nr:MULTISPECIES: type I methionyl aminopeptidase [Sutterella]KAB7652231.1 type I methionyl aminopeptidase [Sutterella seckii]QDA55429.1 type I methionyl aminopeptidase [Sutterella faecalis]
MAISIKTPEDIAGLRIAGRLAAELLDYLTPFVKPGVSTGELDRLAYDYTVNVQKCIPACLGYTPPGMTPYPATTCISINHVVCHGIPSDKKILKQGDIVNIDVTSIKNGYHGDTSRMFIVGKPTIAGKRMVDLAFNTMWAGIDAVRPGGCFNDIGIACQRYADQNGISVVRDYGGHGIGKGFHEEPHVNHFPVHHQTPVFEPGMVFTVEPMVNAGRYGVTMLGDGWTVVTKDHSLSAQWEHMVLVTETGYDVLTVSKGTQAPPAFVKGWKLPENL